MQERNRVIFLYLLITNTEKCHVWSFNQLSEMNHTKQHIAVSTTKNYRYSLCAIPCINGYPDRQTDRHTGRESKTVTHLVGFWSAPRTRAPAPSR